MANPVVVKELLARAKQYGMAADAESQASNRAHIVELLDKGVLATRVDTILKDISNLGGEASLFGTAANEALRASRFAADATATTREKAAEANTIADAGLGPRLGSATGSASSGATGAAPAASSASVFAEALIKAGWEPVPGRPGVFFNPLTGDSYDMNKGASGSGNGNDGSAWGSIAESARQFNISRGDTKERNAQTDAINAARAAIGDEQWRATYKAGADQFRQTFDRNAFENDRSFAQAQDQFAANYALQAAGFEQGQADRQYTAGLDRARMSADIENAGLAESRFNRQQSLAEQEREDRILTRPSDAVARAFSSRGGTSPLSRVTHADLINAGRTAAATQQSESANYLTRLREIAESVQGPRMVALPNNAPNSAANISAGAANMAALRAMAANPANGPQPSSAASSNAAMAAARVPSWVSRFAGGGYTRESRFRVGEEPSGEPNATEETILNPTNAPIGVVPNKQTAEADAAVQDHEQKKVDAIGKVLQHVDDPAIQHALVDEMAKKRKRMGGDMPRFAQGTGRGQYEGLTVQAPKGATYRGRAVDPTTGGVNSRGFYYVVDGAPVYADQLDSVTKWRAPAAGPRLTTQDEILAAANSAASPAVTAAVRGGRMPGFRPATNLTPRRAAMLTSGEREMTNSYLGVTENTTLEDELGGIQSLYGPSVGRSRSRFASY